MANKSKGYVRLARSIQSNFLWTYPEPFDHRSAWIDLILMANHAERAMNTRCNTINVQRGQLVTSMQNLAKRWHWSVNKVRRYMRTLEGQGMILSHGTPYGTVLTLVNYDNFQDSWQADGTANGTDDGTADGTASGTQTKNLERIKRIKNKSVAPPEPDKKDIRVWQ